MYSFRDEWIDNEEEYSMVLDKSYSTLIMYITENNLNVPLVGVMGVV